MGLLGSELLRFRSRKLVRRLAILAVIGIVVGVAIAAAMSNPSTAEPLALGDQPEYLRGAAFIVILIGLVIGASAVGASWQTGTITTILTWEPRRLRWFLSRLSAIAVGVFVLAIALMGMFAIAVAIGAAFRGTTTIGDGWLGEVIATVLRIAAVAVGAAILGAAVAMIGRNTAAALGALFAYLIVVENLLRGLRPALSRFMLGDSLVSIVSGETLAVNTGNGVTQLTPGRGGVVIAAYVVVLVVASMVLFRVRDVH